MKLHILNDVVDDVESIIGSLKSELTCKPINRIPGPCILISSLLGWALRMHVESQGLQQTACLVVNPITVVNFALLFNCTLVGQLHTL